MEEEEIKERAGTGTVESLLSPGYIEKMIQTQLRSPAPNKLL
jgi:hypothetical protein